MKKAFAGYYDLPAEVADDLWDNAVVVLDTNVLLDLYRVPEASRLKLLEMLAAWKGRLWIPHQVGVEFHGQRVSTISTSHSKAENLVEKMESTFGAFRTAVDDAKLDERGHEDVFELLKRIAEIKNEILEKARLALSGQLAPGQPDPVLVALDDAIGDSVGDAPPSQEFLDAIYKEGARRYPLKMGPGFVDKKKDAEENPQFMAGGLVYERKYGDLILWKELISHAREQSLKKILFVTKDVKKDWWQIVRGDHRVAPLSELRAEIMRDGGVEHFWMYTLEEALQRYGDKGNVEVEQAIQDVRSADSDLEVTFEPPEITQFKIDVERSPLWWAMPSQSRLRRAARVLGLTVVDETTDFLAGYTDSRECGMVLTTADMVATLGTKRARVAAAVSALRDEASVTETFIVVLLPVGATDSELYDAEKLGVSLCEFMGRGIIDRLMIGFTQKGHFEQIVSGKVPYGPWS